MERGLSRGMSGRKGSDAGVSTDFRIVCSVTYYELIPTAPVKYYCKILTVISFAEQIVTFEFLSNLFVARGEMVRARVGQFDF